MHQYSGVAVNAARKEFGIRLDYSESSLSNIDMIMENRTRGGLFDGSSTPAETLDEVWRMSLVWGSYVGEVIRLNLGGTWHARAGHTDTIRPMLRVATLEGSPVEKVYKRLTESEANSISNYYYGLKRILVHRDGR
jgi:hypothetical protein